MSYSAKNTLPYRVELYRQLKRKRTAFAYGFVLSLPILVSLAVKFGPSGDDGDSSEFGSGATDIIGLATLGAANFTFLLVTVVALFNGDTVASEASWSTLRYLLASPVPRTRLLVQKMKVSLTLSFIAVLLVPISSWIVGAISFGTAPLQTPLGVTFDQSVTFTRLAIMTGYLAISLLFVAGLAFYLSVRTDAPLGAVGGAVGITILLTILDAISALGSIRQWLPAHYTDTWLDALSTTIDWSEMTRGASYCAMSGILFYALAINKFARKDITS
jgi:ABC-2 type transport system permease protein